MTTEPSAPNPASEKAPRPRPGSVEGHLLALTLAVAGGALGVMGAIVQEVRGGGFGLIAFVGAPIIEETLKPTGVYILLIKWPHLLRNQLYTAALVALSGVSFGLIESAIYVTVYVDEPSSAFVLFRFTVPILLHATASFIVGLGINQRLLTSVRGEVPLLQGSRRYFAAGIILHALYNIVATVLSVLGVFSGLDGD